MSEHRQLTLPESSSKGTAVSRGRRGAGDAKAPLKPGGDDVSVTTPPRGREALQLGFHRPARGCGPHCRGRPGRRSGTGEAPDSVTPPRDAGRVGRRQRGTLRCSRGRRVPHEQTLGMGCVGALTPAVTRASDAGHMPPSDTPPQQPPFLSVGRQEEKGNETFSSGTRKRHCSGKPSQKT